MEFHQKLDDDYTEFKPSEDLAPKDWFESAFKFANKYYSHEIKRALSVSWESITPDLFFHEYIWVVHATGFSAKAVSKFFDRLVAVYGSFEVLSKSDDLSNILSVCNNPQKVKSVKNTSIILINGIETIGWNEWKGKNLDSVDKLSSLPYIGPVTKYHLGRNIGMLDCVKPDLHFVRMAKHWGYADSEQMIKEISSGYDIPLGIADMIAWYYASTFGTINMKEPGDR